MSTRDRVSSDGRRLPLPAPAGRRDARGFVLIELLVALAIAALLIATAVSALSGALAAQARSSGSVEATVIARSRIAALELEPGVGETGGEQRMGGRVFVWRVVTEPYATDAEAPEEPVLPLLRATVEVRWDEAGATRVLEASTLVFGATETRR